MKPTASPYLTVVGASIPAGATVQSDGCVAYRCTDEDWSILIWRAVELICSAHGG